LTAALQALLLWVLLLRLLVLVPLLLRLLVLLVLLLLVSADLLNLSRRLLWMCQARLETFLLSSNMLTLTLLVLPVQSLLVFPVV
jgi:hypothetical protein